MSNPDKPFVPQHAVPAGVVATRWWWVRHAPVREDGGCIYGQKDIGCDTSDRVVFEAVGKILPRNAIWYASHLKRTHQTASAIWAAGFPQPEHLRHERALAEQHLGEWQGLNRAASSPAAPSRSAATGSRRLTTRRRAARALWISIIACAVRSSGSTLNIPAGTSSRWHMVGPSRLRSGSRLAISRTVDSPSRLTIAQ